MKSTRTFYGDVFLDAEELKDRCDRYPIEIEYYKTCTNRKGLINEDYEVYGVEIVKKEYIGKNIKTESSRIDNITKSEKTLDKVMKILKDNTVTPITLNDVISDMLLK